MFTFVSGANFFGEIVEWSGFAVASGTLPAIAFALFTFCNIAPRAYHHHLSYLVRAAAHDGSALTLLLVSAVSRLCLLCPKLPPPPCPRPATRTLNAGEVQGRVPQEQACGDPVPVLAVM